MPTNRRRRLQSRRDDVRSERTEIRLLDGHDFPFMDPINPDAPEMTEDELRAAWEDLRDELLPAFIAQHPGQRPWAWWAFEAPEPRRRIGPGPEPVGEEEMWLGMPRLYRGLPPSLGMYESEADYLRRLDLLTAAEARALAG
jgi:hypothetical protein